MANLSHLDFYNILSLITSAYPTPTYENGFPVTMQPQTFAVINQPVDLNTDNFAKQQIYLAKPFFFSRNSSNKITVNYPAVVLIQRDGIVNVSKGSVATDFDLLFIDKQGDPINVANSISAGDILAQRVDEEVISELFKIALDFLKELKQFVFAEITYSNLMVKNIWVSKHYLNSQKTNGQVIKFNEIENLSSYFLNADNVSSGTMLQKESTAAQTLGVLFELKILINQCLPRPSFNYKPTINQYNPQIC
jgi:hypothetical protein